MIEAKICGICSYFDRNDNNGKALVDQPLKQMQLGRKKVVTLRPIKQSEGFCRAERGLVLGILDESTICRKPRHFIKKV